MKKLKNFTVVLSGLLSIVALIVSCCVEWPTGVEPSRVCDNQYILRQTNSYKFVLQCFTFGAGLQLWITCMFMEIYWNSTKETRKRWKDVIYPVLVVAIGLAVTLTLALVLGNLTGRLSPDYISACRPHFLRQNWKDACREKRTDTFECTQDTSRKAVQSSLFPRLISALSYGMASWVCWMLWRPPSSNKVSNYFILSVSIGFLFTIGCQAVYEASADMWDVFSGYILGWAVAVIVMRVILPRLYPFIYESKIPLYWNDRMTPQARGRIGSEPDLKKSDPENQPV